MVFAEQSHEFGPPVLPPLEESQLWEANPRSTYGLDLRSFDVLGRNCMMEYDLHNQLNNLPRRKPTEQEHRDRVAKRRLIHSVVGLGFEAGMDYQWALEKSDELSQFTDELNFVEGSIAIRSIRQQLITRRDQSFEEQIVKLNQYVQDDPEELSVLLTRKPGSTRDIPDYVFANLESFYIADEGREQGPEPGLVLSGRDGTQGKVPISYHPWGLYIEYSNEQAASVAAAKQRVVLPPR